MFSLEKVQSSAKKLGIDLKVNSKKPGVRFVTKKGEHIKTIPFDKIMQG